MVSRQFGTDTSPSEKVSRSVEPAVRVSKDATVGSFWVSKDGKHGRHHIRKIVWVVVSDIYIYILHFEPLLAPLLPTFCKRFET